MHGENFAIFIFQSILATIFSPLERRWQCSRWWLQQGRRGWRCRATGSPPSYTSNSNGWTIKAQFGLQTDDNQPRGLNVSIDFGLLPLYEMFVVMCWCFGVTYRQRFGFELGLKIWFPFKLNKLLLSCTPVAVAVPPEQFFGDTVKLIITTGWLITTGCDKKTFDIYIESEFDLWQSRAAKAAMAAVMKR